MKRIKKIRSFKDLLVWRKAHQLSIDVANLVKTFPKDEKYDLANQMRRSARSIPSDISEGFGRYHFNDKLTFYERARASLLELRNHFEEALDNSYINKEQYLHFNKRMNEISYLLNRMIKNIKKARDNYEAQKRSKRKTMVRR